ncbi:M23 family metallopeptidase [Kordiimonas pumila]|uniref:LysM peptidoglycan-binding domain-containing protein n=1 Tax=Kordiimonas pumila TaxID=2161677 RepID=A0ABV7D3K0_9PROT|nr:M23 family metallopeptidase [Kordiimonas pumila]
MTLPRIYSMLVIGAVLLTGCVSGPKSPADIQPVYRIRNSPLPVPDVRWNPRRGVNATSTAANPVPVRTQTISANTLTPVSSPTSGGGRVVVKKGDTLYAISRAYGVPVRSLISENNLSEPFQLKIGQVLSVPGTKVHSVQKGETGYSISRQYGVTASALMEANNIKPPYRLAVGQKLKLPGGASKKVASRVRVEATPPSRGRSVSIPAPPPRSASGFIWPVEGKLASRYGPKAGGMHNDGINILASAGSPVKASEAGVVVYASNALQGYGNLLLLKHADGWITAYAHTERLLVRKGQRIDKGQVVARVGSTGGVSQPQLHFEIRKGSRALDPLDYLSGGRGK